MTFSKRVTHYGQAFRILIWQPTPRRDRERATCRLGGELCVLIPVNCPQLPVMLQVILSKVIQSIMKSYDMISSK